MAASTFLPVPFPSTCGLQDCVDKIRSIWDPAVNMDTNTAEKLLNTLDTPLLDELYPHLWFVGKKCGGNIDPLHVQQIKGRQIMPAEDARLHLTWGENKIYVKPVPICLLDRAFWSKFLVPSEPTEQPANGLTTSVCAHRASAIGFLRSYSTLVEHEVDFHIARGLYLIPTNIEWPTWYKFIGSFRNFHDRHVAKRYHYGQLRLSRLNWAVRIWRPRCAHSLWFYHMPYWSTSQFLERATFPLLFAFASTSLVLSSMQVVLSVSDEVVGLEDSTLRMIQRTFWGFSLAVLWLWIVSWALLLGGPLTIILWQLQWGLRHNQRTTVDRESAAGL